MSRLQRPLLFVSLCGCLVLACAFGRPRQDEPVTVESQAVRGAVSVLISAGGGNIGVSAGADGLLMIDDQFEKIAPELEAALKKLGPGAPRLLVNTHHHGDHTDGNKHFGKVATVVAHDNVRVHMLAEKAPAQALPVVTFAEGVTLHFNGEDIRVLHVPNCHTDGDSVVWFQGANVIHLGDLYFQLGYPYVDVAGGGNVLGLIEGLRGLLPQLPEDIRIIPGHGVVTGKKELVEYVTMLETITDRVRAGVEKGQSVDALMAAGVTKEFDERWGHFDFVPPKNFVASIVASLN